MAVDKAKLKRRIIKFAVGFAITLATGKALEIITGADAIQGLYQLQSGWISAVEQMSPFHLLGVFIQQVGLAQAGWLTLPVALWNTMRSYFDAGAFAGLVQIGIGGLAVAVFNISVSKAKSILFGDPGQDGRLIINLVAMPPAAVAAGSGIALVLQVIMLGGLGAFQWITGLAGLAAGASGVAGFCWYCLVKLGEKSTEHMLTPKI